MAFVPLAAQSVRPLVPRAAVQSVFNVFSHQHPHHQHRSRWEAETVTQCRYPKTKLYSGPSPNDGPSTSSSSSTKPSYSTTDSLARARLAASAAKRAVRSTYQEEDRQRNLRLRDILRRNASTNTTSEDPSYPIPAMYAVRVSVDKTLRQELRMNGREKRGRVFIEMDSKNSRTFRGLKEEVHGFFRCLKKSTYTLSAGLPIVRDDGSIYSPRTDDNNSSNNTHDNHATHEFWPISNDNDVLQSFQRALEFYDYHNNNVTSGNNATNYLTRPSILLHVHKDPNAPKPPPVPEYLRNLDDPGESETMTMLSFYAFPPPPPSETFETGRGGGGGIEDPEKFGAMLRRVWKNFGALGRVYVAEEGVNAQMAVPTNVLENFIACCMDIPQLGIHMENGINIDPIPLTMDEFQVAGDMDGKQAPPFKSLNVRVRGQIVADGLDAPLDWQNAGYDMPPLEWHARLKEVITAQNQQQQQQQQQQTQQQTQRKDDMAENDLYMDATGGSTSTLLPLVFDCRNDYETTVGKFEGAEPLNTTNFRDTWDVLKEKLKDKPKDTPVMTYCTGGIRCVKVGAYLTQELGFTNVSRLAGGIIAYDRTLNDNTTTTSTTINNNKNGNNNNKDIATPSFSDVPKEDQLFKGVNYVFDGRVGRQITDDALSTCVTCGEKANLLSNCNNGNCHRRMVQCQKCRETYLGTCSESCRDRVTRMGQKVDLGLTGVDATYEEIRYDDVESYSVGYSTPPPLLYGEIEQNTVKYMPSGAHMISDGAQGRILSNLASMAREGRVLEIGTFVGYSTACLLEGAANAAEAMGGNWDGAGNRERGAFVMSLERDSRAIDLAASHLRIMSDYGLEEQAAEEAEKMRDDRENIIQVEGDSMYFTYKKAGCEIVRVTDALAKIEAMANGTDDAAIEPFDIVFIDGDKTRFLDYIEACLCTNRVLKKGGYMVVDNVLWKGRVLDVSGADLSQITGTIGVEEEDGLSSKELKKSRRARKLANIIHRFNRAIVQDTRVEVVMLPIRDGLSIIKKK